MAAEHLVADDSRDRHAVKHVVDQLVKSFSVDCAKHDVALVPGSRVLVDETSSKRE
jgi:hypothetical protein